MPDAHVDAVRHTPDGLRVATTFACGHRYETVYPRESSGRGVSRAQIARGSCPMARPPAAPRARALGTHHA